MRPSQPRYRPIPNYPCAILDHLFRAEDTFGPASVSYLDVCDRATIPPAMRGTLLLALLTFDYLGLEGHDQVYLTKTGRRLAAAPLN